MNTSSCTYCGKNLNKKPDKRSKTGNVFCNSACAASYNNHAVPKRGKGKLCYECKKKIHSQNSSGLCGQCYRKHTCIRNKTLFQVIKNRKQDANRYGSIREDSRKMYAESGKPLKCLKCGYSIYVEICHIKGIGEFSGDTLIKEINSPNNLVAFCRNHHWEFDHGYLRDVG